MAETDPLQGKVPSARVRGWVDLGAPRTDDGVAVDRSQPGRIALAATGLAVTLDAVACDWHGTDRIIVVTLGKPRLEGRPVRAVELAQSVDAAPPSLGRLGGRYALLLINRARKTVRLQTDRFAVWPLCFAVEGSRISFADRADCVPLTTRPALDTQALFNFVYFHMIPAPRTAYRGVSRLEPATALSFDPAGAVLEPAWQPTFSAVRHGTVEGLAADFRREVRDSVAAEAEAGPVGCFLSGGTDSSTVAGTLKAVTGKATTYSIGFDEQGYDEMAYARIAAKHFGTDHHEHYVTPSELVAAIPTVAAHYDQPFGNSSAVPAFICARLAHGDGLQKLLAGDGGDELFGGNSRYAKQKVFEAWWAVPQAVRALAAPLIANGVTRGLPLLRKAASYVDQASVPMPARLETYNLLKRFGAENVFEPVFLDGLDSSEPANLQAQVYRRQLGAPFVDRMLAYDWRFTLADNDLPKVSGTTQLAGIAVGYPLLSDALVDLSMKLAPGDKVRGLKLRYFFKRSLADFLPPEIIAKKKHGFGLPVGKWLVKDAAFRGLARDALVGLASRRIVQRRMVDDLFSTRLEENPGYYGELIWVLMMLELWLAAREPAWTSP